jgi:hypothetical protein
MQMGNCPLFLQGGSEFTQPSQIVSPGTSRILMRLLVNLEPFISCGGAHVADSLAIGIPPQWVSRTWRSTVEMRSKSGMHTATLLTDLLM